MLPSLVIINSAGPSCAVQEQISMMSGSKRAVEGRTCETFRLEYFGIGGVCAMLPVAKIFALNRFRMLDACILSVTILMGKLVE